MKTIKHQIEISSSQEEIFDLTQNYSKRLEWDPYLAEAYLLDGAKDANIGVKSLCKNHSGSTMVSKYISFNRPNVAAVTMTEGPWILKRFSGAWNVKYVKENSSILIFTYNFELKGGIMGKLLLPLAAAKFSKDMRARLISIKSFIEQP